MHTSPTPVRATPAASTVAPRAPTLWRDNPLAFHRRLAQFNQRRVAVAMPSADWEAELSDDLSFRRDEGHFIEALRREVADRLPPDCLDADAFVAWFEQLLLDGPGQRHSLFDWLAQQATMPQMRWFLTQEVAGEAGFDDLVAYTQVKLPAQAKLECARNFWDEMGHGRAKGMHGPMLDTMVQTLDLQPAIESTVWESLALSNLMLGLATARRYTYHSLGALGVVELTAPGRVELVSKGMRRLGLNGQTRAYFDLHAMLDKSHARQWIQEIIRPLVAQDAACSRFLAEGALMRLVSGQRCFERYCRELRAVHLH